MPPRSRARTDLTAAERRTLVHQRQRMDRLNLRLRTVLQQRAQLAVAIARWKHARGVNVPDSEREIQMLQRMLRKPGAGFDRQALARIFAVLFDESRRAAVRATSRRRRG